MALLYRAIWADDNPSVCDFAFEYFCSWVAEKSGAPVDVPRTGSVAWVSVPGRRSRDDLPTDMTVRVERAGSPDLRDDVLRARFIESRPDGTRWETTLRSWMGPRAGRGSQQPINDDAVNESSWIWVDVDAVGPIPLDTFAVGAPRLVVSLLDAGSRPRAGVVPLSASPRTITGATAGEALVVDEISHVDRTVPVVVFCDDAVASYATSGQRHDLRAIVERTAAQLAGIASVATLDPLALAELREVLGDDHAVWNGAFRMYLPDLDPAVVRDGWRHRYVRPERFAKARDLAAKIAARALAPASATRRPPDTWGPARAVLDQVRRQESDTGELLDYASGEIDRLNRELNDERAANDERALALVIDWEEALEDAARQEALAEQLGREVAHLRERLASVGLADDSWQVGPSGEPPVRAMNPSEAAALAQLHLSDRLVLPQEALRDLDILDATTTAAAWGQTSWRGLQALHAYARDIADGKNPGSFWTWCQHSGNSLAWPATEKKLAMTESQSVQNIESLRRCRVLPVAREVDATGRVFMPAHLKIATGGGNLAPRIYFHVDPANAKVHVGFFGPHKHMPNTKT